MNLMMIKRNVLFATWVKIWLIEHKVRKNIITVILMAFIPALCHHFRRNNNSKVNHLKNFIDFQK